MRFGGECTGIWRRGRDGTGIGASRGSLQEGLRGGGGRHAARGRLDAAPVVNQLQLWLAVIPQRDPHALPRKGEAAGESDGGRLDAGPRQRAGPSRTARTTQLRPRPGSPRVVLTTLWLGGGLERERGRNEQLWKRWRCNGRGLACHWGVQQERYMVRNCWQMMAAAAVQRGERNGLALPAHSTGTAALTQALPRAPAVVNWRYQAAETLPSATDA